MALKPVPQLQVNLLTLQIADVTQSCTDNCANLDRRKGLLESQTAIQVADFQAKIDAINNNPNNTDA